MDDDNLVKRLEYYLSKENLENDYMLNSDTNNWCMSYAFML